MSKFTRGVLFFVFFFSGFAGLVYQVVWTRMAFMSFGIIAPVLSVVLSVFMLGLAVGSWAGGKWIAPIVNKTKRSAAYFYAAAEFVIGLGAFVVPYLFDFGARLLLGAGEMNSFTYFVFSALALALAIFPWCVCMGLTFPFMMGYVRECEGQNTDSFSFLYTANVLGAMAGVSYSAIVLIEKLGFHRTLWVAAAANFTIAFVSACLGWQHQKSSANFPEIAGSIESGPVPEPSPKKLTKWILFSTGFASMAMEVVWTRAFTPVLKTQVYSFAMVVFTYLGATFLGSALYRQHLRRGKVISKAALLSMLAFAAFVPIIVNDLHFVVEEFWTNQWSIPNAAKLLGGICPFCALLGYLTPQLIDEYSAGEPKRAGQAYAINVLGCILGPLAACYLLLPFLSPRHALILLAVPFVVFWLPFHESTSRVQRLVCAIATGAALVWSLFITEDFEEYLRRGVAHVQIHRDYMASVIAFGSQQDDKNLLVNGIGMTTLTPITKFIADLPLAYHSGPVKSVLVICFGMGTTFRTALTWNVDTTAVELVPGVVKSFPFYHGDADQVLKNPLGHIIIDDGRRYLNRTDKKFDVIVVDPPPPIEAAGSSLLFSTEFYRLAQKHLNPGGIVQMWFPGGPQDDGQAVIRSMVNVFPYVRAFASVESWGLHLIGSMSPIYHLDAKQLAARLPDAAKKDLLEWTKIKDPAVYLNIVATNEFSVPLSLNTNRNVVVDDDHPYNEYYLLRYSK